MAKNTHKKKYHISHRKPEDWHHILFQKRHWQQGYAKALREHWYMGGYIPRDTLHRTIHSKIHDVPTPNGRECRKAFEELCRREQRGLICANDTLDKRIDFLIEMWKNDNCEATIAILKWQKQVIQKFYERREPYADQDGYPYNFETTD